MGVSVSTWPHETTKSQLTTENMAFKIFENPHVDRFELALTVLQNHSIIAYQERPELVFSSNRTRDHMILGSSYM
jgi:hypothetical protein